MKTLFKAIADFQQEVPIIHKGTQGYGYSYADLPSIFKIINPLLYKHKLGFYQMPTSSGTIKTIVYHFDGEFIESEVNIPENVSLKGMNDFQVLGSAITYLRRYSLECMLGLVTSKDIDASGEQVKPAWWSQAVAAIKKGSTTVEEVAEKKKLSPQMALELQTDVS